MDTVNLKYETSDRLDPIRTACIDRIGPEIANKQVCRRGRAGKNQEANI